MKYEKIIFLLIFVMFLAGICCVSAENSDDVDLSAIDNATDEVISVDDSIGDNLNADEEEVLSGSRSSVDVNSWNGLDNAVNGNSGAEVVNIKTSLTPGNQIVINHNVTIIGSPNTYIGGSAYNHKVTYSNILFYSNATGLSITLKNIKFQNCGGNTLMKFAGNGTYVLDNCTFENITAAGYKQVVVHLNEGTCNITDCTFEKCQSSYGTVSNFKSDEEPDAVHMYVYGTTFRNNYAGVEPGAINNCGHLTVYDSTFEDNSAAMWAGAIHTHSNANATIFRSTFINNVAEWNGGALSTYSYLRVVNCTFTNNVARTDKGGGAIFGFSQGSRPYIIVENCDFDNNTACTGNGGAIAIINGILIVDDSRFNDNYAGGNYGGAISSVGMGINDFITNVTDCRFKNNSANSNTSMGGAIFAINMGHLRVYSSIFINDTAVSGNEIAFKYSGKKTNRAFFTYEDNTFYGADNASGAIYLYNNNIVVVDINNIFLNTDQYVEPENETTPSVVPIPSTAATGNQVWNATIEDVLGGSPLIIDGKIFVPKGQYVYCLNLTNGDVLWNVSSDAGYFHELALHGNVLLAPCAGDKLYMIDPTTGDEIQPTSNIIQASSSFAPAIDGNTIYISSECGYGADNNTWIAVVEYNGGVYSYVGSILEINGIAYGDYALLSAPILWNDYLWVNTVNGLMRVDLTTNNTSPVLANTVGKPVLGGNYMYVLTRNNHICRLDANGDLVSSIAVGGNVGSTLAINGDNTVLYAVNANGEIYRAGINSNNANFIYKINPVSSALTVGNDGYLYIGDDEGIFWVIKSYSIGRFWYGDILWAYNASSSISGIPIINNDIVYIGTEDAFYALSNVSNRLNVIAPVLSKFNSKAINDLLGACYPDEILATPTIRPISPNTQLQSSDFEYGDSIYLLNGTYTLEVGFWIGCDFDGNPFDNILIKPAESADAIIMMDDNIQQICISIAEGRNITFENIKFVGDSTKNYNKFMTVISIDEGANDIIFKNCTFENIVNTYRDNYYESAIFSIKNTFDYAGINTGDVHLENCKFINVSAVDAIMWVNSEPSDLYISNCVFENNNAPYMLNLKNANTVYLNDNRFGFVVPIIVENGKIAEASVKSLNTTLTVNTPNDIEFVLVDDNGNRIKSSNLQLKINDEVKAYTFDETTGVYIVKNYIPPEAGEISIDATCSNVDVLTVEPEKILVKSGTDLSVNCSDSTVYGTEFKVNATLDSTITGENITFTVLNSTDDLVKSANTTITDGFASYSFTDLPAGDYTVVADYAGSTSFVSATGNKTFTITQAESSIEIVVLNNGIYVYEPITVKANVPDGATGNVTFTLNDDRTVNVTEFATFEGLANGTYTIYAVYNGDGNYKASERVNTTITVVKYDLNLNVDADDVDYGEALVVKVTTDANFTGEVLVKVGDKNQTANITKGMGNATFTGLTAAEYNITAIFSENDRFNADVKNTTATVRSVVPADQAFATNVPANSQSPTFSIKLDKDATGNFTVIIDDGKTFNKTVELKNGSASITVENLAVGSHNVSVSYTGDGKYAPITQNTTVTISEPAKTTPATDNKVTKKNTKIVAKNKTFKAKKKVKKYTITLKSGKTLLKKVKVTLKIKGKTYKATTNNKGKATFKIKNLKKKGKYTAVIKFAGNANYKPTSKKVKITVKK